MSIRNGKSIALRQTAWSLVVVLSFIGAMAAGAETVKGRVGAFAPQDTPWERQWLRLMEATKQAGLELDYFIRGELGSQEAMIPAIKRNRLQVGGISLQGMATLVPELTVTMIPFLFESPEEVDFIYDNFLYEPVNALLQEQGVTLIRWLESGWFNIAANRPILTPSAFKGVRIGGSPNFAIQRFLISIGADAVPISSVDMVQALETGLIDGTIKPTAMAFTFRGYVTDFMVANVSYDTGGLLANMTWHKDLSDRHKYALRYGMGTDDKVRRDIRDLVTKQLGIMQYEGVTIHRLTPEQRRAWVRQAQSGHEATIEAAGGRAEEFYDILLRGKAAYRDRGRYEPH